MWILFGEMQSLCGRIRLPRGPKFNSSKIVEFEANWRGNCIIGDHGKMGSLAFKGGVAAANIRGFSNCYSTGYSSSLLSNFVSSSALILHRKFVSKTDSLSSFRNYGIQSVAPVSKGSSTASVLTFTTRTITTVGKSSESSPQDTSPPVPDTAPRIKFKRLDKTARHIMQILDKESVEKVKAEREIPDIRPGYIVQLKVEVPENKRRVSIVKGIVIARRNAGLNTTFRLRRLVAGVGVESLFPLYSPNIKEIKVLDKKKVRRAKLYYLRDKMNALKGQ